MPSANPSAPKKVKKTLKTKAPKKTALSKSSTTKRGASGSKKSQTETLEKLMLGMNLGNLSAATTAGGDFQLKESKSHFVVLYFYPKDNTPGCTLEGYDFKALYPQFKKLKTEILGVSRDSIKSHSGFIEKCGFPFDLLSDPDEILCKKLDVIREKSLYGRKYMGVDRSTFILTPKGELKAFWRQVKVKGHAEEVLEKIKELSQLN